MFYLQALATVDSMCKARDELIWTKDAKGEDTDRGPLATIPRSCRLFYLRILLSSQGGTCNLRVERKQQTIKKELE